MTATKLTTTATRANYADAISAAIALAEAILGTLVVTRIECVAVMDPTHSDPARVTSYEATVESTWARQREEAEHLAEPDPLDEADHQDRLDGGGSRWTHRAHLWCPESCACYEGGWKFDDLDGRFGPLTFAPDAAPDAPRADLTASEAEGIPEDATPAPEPLDELPCPKCAHEIDSHGWDEDYALTRCLTCDDPADCRQAPSDIARAGIEAAVRVDAEFSRLLAVSTDPAASLRRAATMEAVGVTDDQVKWFAQILSKGRLGRPDLQRLAFLGIRVEEDA